MMEQMSKPSSNDVDNLSHVTTPPIRIPGIHEGKGNTGKRKSSVPGIGTPMAIPTTVLTTKIQAESFKVQSKLFAQGASSRSVYTTTITTPTHDRVNQVPSKRTMATANPMAQSHQVKGCSDGLFMIIS
jgi:hypothetical protein